MMRNALSLVLALIIAPQLHAACDATHPEECTVQEFRAALDAARKPAADAEKKDAAEAAVDPTEKKVGNQNRATTTPDPFAARLHNSWQDFIVPFSFAINKIEESKDGRSLIARFNAIRTTAVKLGFTATATKPSLYAKIAEAIPKEKRDDAVAKLNATLDDYDDVTIAASLAFDTTDCKKLTDLCFGRNPETYRNKLSAALADVLTEAADRATSGAAEQAQGDLLRRLRGSGFNEGDQTPIRNIPEPLKTEVIASIKKGQALDAEASAEAIAFLAKAGVNNLATLIDNQPQIALTGSWRELGNLGGPNELAVTAEFQFGFNNLRRAAKKGLTDSLLIPPTKQPSDKIVLSASYKRSTHYALASLEGTGVTVDNFTPIDVPRTSDWFAKLQWGRKLGIPMGEQQPRLDVSGEFQRAGKGGVRTTNRLVATATVTVPFSEKASIPLSLKYANKPEFLGEVRKELSVHFGLSYRLPWEAD